MTVSRSAVLRHLPVVLLSGLYLYACGIKAARQPLWFDEIVTYYVSILDGPRTIIGALLGRMDNHPPVDYLARHLSMALLAPSEFAFRLPSIIGLLIASLSLYLFVLRRTSLMPALVAFALPFTTLALEYGYEGRGYALLMASVCLALLAWQLATEKASAVRLCFLAVALSLGPFIHYYGVLNYVPIAAGEAWRCWRRRRISWPIIGCFAVSLASLGLLVPFAIRASQFSATFWTTLTPSLVASAYIQALQMSIPAFVGFLLVFAFAAIAPVKPSDGFKAAPTIPPHEIVAAIVLCLLPLTTYGLAEFVTGAYNVRYVLNMIPGVALLTGYAVYCLASQRNAFAILTAAIFGGWATVILLHLGFFGVNDVPVAAENEKLIAQETRPIVIEDGHLFLKYHYYLTPHGRDKIFSLSDRAFYFKYEGNDSIVRAFENLTRFVPMNVVDLCTFAAEHKEFLIMTYKPSWLTARFSEEIVSVETLKTGLKRRMIFSVKLSKTPSGCSEKP